MENYKSDKDTYIQRMNKTAKSKFSVVETHLKPDMNILDFGSGVSPKFISDVESSGANYFAYDISKTVQTELSNMGVTVVTNDDLQKMNNTFDLVYLSSVFHEIMSYLNRQERTATMKMIDSVLKPNGKIIIRDWSAPYNHYGYLKLEAQPGMKKELDIWKNILKENSIANVEENNNIYSGLMDDMYEFIFHSVWGLKSLNRESKETYIIKKAIYDWIINPLDYTIENFYKEYDESYIPYIQKYFKIDKLPFPTKNIYILKKKS